MSNVKNGKFVHKNEDSMRKMIKKKIEYKQTKEFTADQLQRLFLSVNWEFHSMRNMDSDNMTTTQLWLARIFHDSM